MPFTTYAELQSAVADQLARSDLTTQIPDFITLFEAYVSRKLNVRQTETTASLTTTSGVVSLPTDYLATRSLVWNGDFKRPLTYAHPEAFDAFFPSDPTGISSIYTIVGSTLKTAPIDDTNALTLDYFAKNAAVSSSLNWLFSNHPDAYNAGTLFEAYMFLKDTDNAAIWKARRDEIIGELEIQDFRNRGPMQIMIGGITP